MTWDNANAHCQNTYGTELARIYDAATAQAMLDMVIAQKVNDGNTWIGLTDSGSEGIWKWSDGLLCAETEGSGGSDGLFCNDNTKFAWWGSGAPNGGTAENCAHIANTAVAGGGVGELLNDLSCATAFPFLCNAAYQQTSNVYINLKCDNYLQVVWSDDNWATKTMIYSQSSGSITRIQRSFTMQSGSVIRVGCWDAGVSYWIQGDVTVDGVQYVVTPSPGDFELVGWQSSACAMTSIP